MTRWWRAQRLVVIVDNNFGDINTGTEAPGRKCEEAQADSGTDRERVAPTRTVKALQ